MGMDLNRSWNRISEWIHPTIHAAKNMLETLDKDTKVPLDCVLDLHAHSNGTGVFFYGNTYDNVYRYENLPKKLAKEDRIFIEHFLNFDFEWQKFQFQIKYWKIF